MKFRELVKKIEALGFIFERNGKEHDLYRLGDTIVVIPRHKEVNELTARSIIKKAEKAAIRQKQNK